jgi:KaiC/GvpD/RAD55 family RecA-like ATPase
MVKETNIPREIHDFFENKQSQFLLVKGGSGTGKTSFSLELLREFTTDDKCGVCVFTRLVRNEVFTNFPWVEEGVTEGKYIIFDRDDGISDANRFRKEFTELCAKHDISIFIMDTIQPITERFDSPNRKLKELHQTISAEQLNTVIVSEESAEGYLDYLVGGIVTLSRSELEGRRVRTISLDKLRGVEIKQPRYVMTLQDGKFKSFNPFPTEYTEFTQWKAIPDTETTFSTGIADLDKLLGGGYKRGSYNVIEVADNVSSPEYLSIIRPVILNFLSQRRGVVVVLTGGDHPDTIRNDFTRFIPEAYFDNYMRIADYFSTDSTKPYVMPLGISKEDAIRKWTATIAKLRGKENRPILDFTGFDTLEYLRGETIAIKELLNGVAATKVSNDLGLGVIKPGLKLTQGIRNMADTYLKIVDIHNTCCIYGIKPQTIMYVITPDETMGYPHVKLTPIV